LDYHPFLPFAASVARRAADWFLLFQSIFEQARDKPTWYLARPLRQPRRPRQRHRRQRLRFRHLGRPRSIPTWVWAKLAAMAQGWPRD